MAKFLEKAGRKIGRVLDSIYNYFAEKLEAGEERLIRRTNIYRQDAVINGVEEQRGQAGKQEEARKSVEILERTYLDWQSEQIKDAELSEGCLGLIRTAKTSAERIKYEKRIAELTNLAGLQNKVMVEQRERIKGLEKAVSSQRTRIQKLREAIPDTVEASLRIIGIGYPYALITPQGNVKYISDEACYLLGVERRQVLNHFYSEFLNQEDMERTEPEQGKARNHEIASLKSITISNQKGEKTRVNVEVIPIYLRKLPLGYVLSLDQSWTQVVRGKVEDTLALARRFLKQRGVDDLGTVAQPGLSQA